MPDDPRLSTLWKAVLCDLDHGLPALWKEVVSAPLTIRSYPAGPRCWVFGQRVHHGATGCMLVAAGLAAHRAGLGVVGLLLCLHDRADVREWFRRAGLDSLANTL